MSVTVLHDDCLRALPLLPEASVDSVVTDPPYHLTAGKKGGTGEASVNLDSPYGRSRVTTGFMSKEWDGGDIAFRPETWAAVLRVLKPGGHLVAFGAPRNYHRLACAIEDAGFEIRDSILDLIASDDPVRRFMACLNEEQCEAFLRCIDDSRFGGLLAWIFGTGFPKSHNLDGEWEGWGTALKPAFEPIILARKPLIGTVAENVLAHGTGALNIDGCRIDGEPWKAHRATGLASVKFFSEGDAPVIDKEPHALGRWPANVVHDGSDEVLAGFPHTKSGTGAVKKATAAGHQANAYGKESRPVGTPNIEYGDEGSAARFFYTAKASAKERAGSKHPTVKPLALMRWLVRLVTPPGGVVLDPFAGTGTTGQAAIEEGFRAVLIEREEEYRADIGRRLSAVPKLIQVEASA